VDILNRDKKDWLKKVNSKVHSTTQEIPLKRWAKEDLTAVEGIADYDLIDYYL
jgi:hypothetical protein